VVFQVYLVHEVTQDYLDTLVAVERLDLPVPLEPQEVLAAAETLGQ